MVANIWLGPLSTNIAIEALEGLLQTIIFSISLNIFVPQISCCNGNHHLYCIQSLLLASFQRLIMFGDIPIEP
jgi:hypothetical protein